MLGSASLLRPGQHGHSSESAVGGRPRPAPRPQRLHAAPCAVAATGLRCCRCCKRSSHWQQQEERPGQQPAQPTRPPRQAWTPSCRRWRTSSSSPPPPATWTTRCAWTARRSSRTRLRRRCGAGSWCWRLALAVGTGAGWEPGLAGWERCASLEAPASPFPARWTAAGTRTPHTSPRHHTTTPPPHPTGPGDRARGGRLLCGGGAAGGGAAHSAAARGV